MSNERVSAFGRKFQRWIETQKAAGSSTVSTLLWRLPRRVLRKTFSSAYNQFFRGLLLPILKERYRSELTRAFAGCKSAPFVVIAVPGLLHYLIPCISLASRHVSVVLVRNGLARWEEEHLRATFPSVPLVGLPTLPGAMLGHGLVAGFLIELADRNFALHDPDLYVFNPKVYEELRPREEEIAVGAFGVLNRKAQLLFPATHLLALNVQRVRATTARHKIGVDVYHRTPAHVATQLRGVDIGDHNFPKEYLDFYDLFNLLWAVAASDGTPARVLPLHKDDTFHVGGVSYHVGNYYLEYVNDRFLGFPTAAPFADRYRATVLSGRSSQELIASARSLGDAKHLAVIDAACDRLARELAQSFHALEAPRPSIRSSAA